MPGWSPILAQIAIYIFNYAGICAAWDNPYLKTPDPLSFDWAALKPTQDIKWHECYAPPPAADKAQQILSSPPNPPSRIFSCARLSFPLDYHNNTNPHNVSVPILKVSSPPSEGHLGTIIAAFGGAGNSRIQDLVILTAAGFLNELDPNFEYDFVTFDNRGFGYSSPSAKCFDHVLDGVLFDQRLIDLGGIMSTGNRDEDIEVRLAAAKAKGEICSNHGEEDADIRRHMSTVYAARDMLEILKRLPGSSSKSADTFVEESSNDETQKLKFIGLSYGTMVGQFFASLYPEYVSRMVLDGTGDARDWVDKWQMGHLIDTDAVWASFYDDCFDAKEACPLWRGSDSRSGDIESRISKFVESLKQRPLFSVADGSARLITYRDVKLAMYWVTMAPGVAAPTMALILDELIRGFTNVTIDFPFEDIPTASSIFDMESPDRMAASNADAGVAVNCADAEDITNSSLADFKSYLSALENQSSVAAFFQGERKIRCMGWPIRPAWRFTGPFTSKLENGSSRLSTPILFIGNRLDPMTSLVNARKVANDFPGSVVLVQNARGHCALGNVVPSPCTLRHLRIYLRDGTLPEHGTVCGEDCNLFDWSCFGGGKDVYPKLLGNWL